MMGYSIDRWQKRQNNMRRFVFGMVIFVFVLCICSFGVMGYFAIEAIDVIKTDGLKSVLETIWNGPIK